jgi:spermidine synthase
VLPWRLVASAPIPGDTAKLRLLERGGELVIRSGARELMSSRVHASEEALGELAAAKLAGREAPRILIGGLGMGYTLAAALGRLGARASLLVVELVPAVVEWNRGLLGPLAGHPLRDPRVEVRIGDVAAVLREAPAAYDAVILDVDNGPEATTRRANDWLYGPAGLRAVQAALRVGGVMALWSASADRRFEKRLRAAGFRVEEERPPGRGRGRGRRVVWLGVVP